MILRWQIVVFTLVGILNTAVGYGIYAFFIYLGMSYPVALLFATCLGVLFNFKTIGEIVFKNKSNSNRLLIKFIIVYGFLYCLNLALITFLQLLIDNPYMAGFVVIIPSAILAFILNKYLVFNNKLSL